MKQDESQTADGAGPPRYIAKWKEQIVPFEFLLKAYFTSRKILALVHSLQAIPGKDNLAYLLY